MEGSERKETISIQKFEISELSDESSISSISSEDENEEEENKEEDITTYVSSEIRRNIFLTPLRENIKKENDDVIDISHTITIDIATDNNNNDDVCTSKENENENENEKEVEEEIKDKKVTTKEIFNQVTTVLEYKRGRTSTAFSHHRDASNTFSICKKGNRTIMRKLLNENPKAVYHTNSRGQSLLCIALESNDIPMVQLFLEFGALYDHTTRNTSISEDIIGILPHEFSQPLTICCSKDLILGVEALIGSYLSIRAQFPSTSKLPPFTSDDLPKKISMVSNIPKWTRLLLPNHDTKSKGQDITNSNSSNNKELSNPSSISSSPTRKSRQNVIVSPGTLRRKKKPSFKKAQSHSSEATKTPTTTATISSSSSSSSSNYNRNINSPNCNTNNIAVFICEICNFCIGGIRCLSILKKVKKKEKIIISKNKNKDKKTTTINSSLKKEENICGEFLIYDKRVNVDDKCYFHASCPKGCGTIDAPRCCQQPLTLFHQEMIPWPSRLQIPNVYELFKKEQILLQKKPKGYLNCGWCGWKVEPGYCFGHPSSNVHICGITIKPHGDRENDISRSGIINTDLSCAEKCGKKEEAIVMAFSCCCTFSPIRMWGNL